MGPKYTTSFPFAGGSTLMIWVDPNIALYQFSHVLWIWNVNHREEDSEDRESHWAANVQLSVDFMTAVSKQGVEQSTHTEPVNFIIPNSRTVQLPASDSM